MVEQSLDKSTIVYLNDDYRFRTDPRCIIVERKLKRKDESEPPTWGDPSYHGTLKQALERVFEAGVRKNLTDFHAMLMLKAEIFDKLDELVLIYKTRLK